jgi:hypothetical protein
MKIILDKKPRPTDEEIEKHTNIWMLNLYFSCDKQLSELAHQLSKMKLSNKEYFDLCYYGIPKMKSFIQYNAKKVVKEENVKMIMEYYGYNYHNAKQASEIISDNEMKEIVSFFKDRGIKK